jgi:hypothetical protein
MEHLFKENFSKKWVCTIYNGIKWKTKNKNGLKDKAIFVLIVITFIITLYELKSPLKKYIKDRKKGGGKRKKK